MSNIQQIFTQPQEKYELIADIIGQIPASDIYFLGTK